MHMYTFLLGCTFVLFMGGCGGSNGSVEAPPNTKLDTNLSRAIANGLISGYSPNAPIEDQYLAVINYYRSQPIQCNDSAAIRGPSPALVWNASLSAAAYEHSNDMKINSWYNHLGSGTASDVTGNNIAPGHQSTFFERIQYNGYNGNTGAENIAKYESSAIPPNDVWMTAMEMWITSTSGHCSNIMNPNFTDFGMSEVRSTTQNTSGFYSVYWTQNFGG